MNLADVRVLDFTRLLPGPYATQLLADLGADVIKIEDTDRGDYARYMPPLTDDGGGAIFDAVNRGKRSLSVDCSTQAGQDIVHELVSDADLVVESFRPGVTERLGIDYDTLADQNPELVYVSITGYGQTGPLSDRPGHDLNYCGRAGLLSMTRADATVRPQIPGYPIADMAGGVFGALAALSGLCNRAFGDGADGTYVDLSMTDVVLSLGTPVVASAFAGQSPRPGATPLTGGVPWYDVYETADGRYVTLAALEPKFWRAFCETVDRPELIEHHLATDQAVRDALRTELTELFAQQSRAEWIERFETADVPVEPVLDPKAAVDTDRARERVVVEERSPPRVGFPAAVELPDSDETVPARGANTREILQAAGYDESTIETLAENAVIASSDR